MQTVGREGIFTVRSLQFEKEGSKDVQESRKGTTSGESKVKTIFERRGISRFIFGEGQRERRHSRGKRSMKYV